MLTLGIDDAGRGPVIGPMILAGCVLDKKVEKELVFLGVKDSKDITQKKREFLEKIIKEKAEAYKVVQVSPVEIELNAAEGIKLNEVEAIECASIINALNTGEKMKVVLDCPSPSLAKWGEYLKSRIKTLSNLEISCEHKADRNHVAVSAASILAKCAREREMDKLKKEYGPEIGSGYTSDSVTQKFLEKYAKKYQDKGIFRRTWITWKKAYDKASQKKLF